jgi:NADH dehydrogenase FAD-containing subunit
MKKTRVVIAGGELAGLSAAQYFEQTLARSRDVEVTPISRENFILFTLGFRDSSQEKSPSEMFRFG